LLRGIRLQAQAITVYDDPRFSQEYFVRAEELTAGIRWWALLSGRFEFDTVSLVRPSLNLVRLEDGHWNIESWLPPLPAVDRASPTGVAAISSPPTAAVNARLSRVEIEDGRINFKRDSRKLPLALVAVNGRFDHGSAGRWSIDVEATPMRAPASLQQAGTIRLRGTVGGVSARLRPAQLSLTWRDASLADLSRLAQGGDVGVRGMFDAELTTRIDEPVSPELSWGEWEVEGAIRLRGVHGWALAARDTDPGANIDFQAKWNSGDDRLLITSGVIEAPHSRVVVTGDLDWSHGFRPSVQIASARVGLADLLAWHRAFRADIAEDLTVEGALEAQATLAGWPLRVEELELASAGATIGSPVLPGPIRIGPVATAWSNDTLRFLPVQLSLPAAASERTTPTGKGASAAPAPRPARLLIAEASVGQLRAITALPEARYRLAVSGSTNRAQDLLAVARAWGWSNGRSWAAQGPVSLRLVWTGSLQLGMSPPTGTIQVRGVQLDTPFMNRPLLLSAATIDLRGSERRVKLQAAEAFGTRWTGSLDRLSGAGAWNFDLAADRLDAADFYAWFGEPARPNLFQRMLPFGDSSATVTLEDRAEALQSLHARGRLRVAELAFSPLQVERIDAEAEISDSSLFLHRGRANLAGGRVTGDFRVRLSGEPSYSFDVQLSGIALSDFAQTASLPGRVEGSASGDLQLSAHGWDRVALATSLEGQGLLRAREVSFAPIALASAVSAEQIESAAEIEPRRFALTTEFQFGDGRVRLNQFLLERPGEQTEVAGTVDFAGRLDLRMQSPPSGITSVLAADGATPIALWTIGGTLDTPRVASVPVPTPTSPAGVPSASR
jgi:hypothetical protein